MSWTSQSPEDDDIQLTVDEFERLGATSRRLHPRDFKGQKSPDLRLTVGGQIAGHCEVKSVHSVRVDIRRGVDAQKQRLSNALTKAVDQLASVDPVRDQLWIVAFINHDESADAGDFQAVLRGFECEAGTWLYHERQNPNRKVTVARRFVDLALWFGEQRVFKVWNVQPHRVNLLERIGMPKRFVP